MVENAVNESITMEDEDDGKNNNNPNTFQDAVKELGSILFSKYPDKTTKLSYENINAFIRIDALNEYHEVNFGYRYKVLDEIKKSKQKHMVSHEGFGIEKIIEFVKSIQASFEQTQLPARMRDMFNR